MSALNPFRLVTSRSNSCWLNETALQFVHVDRTADEYRLFLVPVIEHHGERKFLLPLLPFFNSYFNVYRIFRFI